MSMPKDKATRPASYGFGGWRPMVKPDPTRDSWWLDIPQNGFTAEAEAHSIEAHTKASRRNGRNVEERRGRKLKEPLTTLDGAATPGDYD
jgi:hypothetical protein